MQIDLLSAEYPPTPGGIGDYSRQLALALGQRGHGVRVLTIAEDMFQTIDPVNQQIIQSHRIGKRRAPWSWGSWQDVAQVLAATPPAILHIQYQTGAYGMHPAINLLPWQLQRTHQQAAICVTAHDLLPPYLFPKAGKLRWWITKRLIRDADGLVVTNGADLARAGAARIVQQIPIGSNIAVTPPAGYNRADWRKSLQMTDDETVLAYFGLLSPSKGVDGLLNAFAQLPLSIRLLIIGGEASAPQDQRYAAQVRERIAAEFGQRVVVTGHCSEAEVSGHLLAADIAVLPFTDGASFRRGSLLAALAHGLPVITTIDSQEAPNADTELLRSAVALVPAKQDTALAQAIRQLASDTATRTCLGAAGKALAARFDWGTIAAQHEAFYAAVLQAKARGW